MAAGTEKLGIVVGLAGREESSAPEQKLEMVQLLNLAGEVLGRS